MTEREALAAVRIGQFVAALAHVECCDIIVEGQSVSLSARYEPSAGLSSAFNEGAWEVHGALGWALPLWRPRELLPRQKAFGVVQWPTRGIGICGTWGRN